MILLFGIIILLGESFKIQIFNFNISISFIVIIVLIFMFLASNPKFFYSTIDKLFILFFFLFLFFLFLGLVQGNHLNDILEDAYPIFTFIFLYFIFRNFIIEDTYLIWRYILLFSVLACLKVILINFFSFNIDWSNAWQATKEPIPFTNAFRIILRGGDIFLSIALVSYLLFFLFYKRNSPVIFFVLILLFFSVFISLSRSSYLADIVSIMIVLFLYSFLFIKKKLIYFAIISFIGILLVLPFINIINIATNIFEQRNAAFDNNNVAVDFRNEERDLIFEKAKSFYFLGNGFGSFFYLDYSGSEKSDGRSIYSHDFNSWFIFKMGIFTLVILYLILFLSFLNIHKFLKINNIRKVKNEILLFIVSLQSSLLIVLIISIFANKINTISGALFLSFYVSNSLNIYKNESCI